MDQAAILASIGLVTYDWRIDTDILTWGGNAGDVLQLGDPATIATGRGYAAYLDSRNVATRYDAVMQPGGRDDGAGVAYQVEYCINAGPGGATKLWAEDTGRWFAGLDGRPARAHGVVRIINDRHNEAERLAYLSRFDSLTGEMNRQSLAECLSAAFEEARRYRTSCGFLLLSIDNLARVNEAYSFDVADEVIAAIAQRIKAKMRGGDQIGRFSGNKFGVVLKTCKPDDLVAAAERFLSCVREEMVQTTVGPVAASISIGGITAPRHARSAEEMLLHAQASLDAAKAKRRGSFVAYRPNVARETLRRENLRATDEIVAALNERRILVAFEPVVTTAARTPAFYECLMRIRRADGSLAPASGVIPVAERLGLVRLIDNRMIQLVVEQLIEAPELVVSLNASPASITDPEWWSSLEAQLKRHPGVAERMILEITESTAIQDLSETLGLVTRAKDFGCRIAIDDFGAGFTSFRNLRELSVDIIKIDGAFVQNLTRSEDDRAFVRTLIELGASLKLKTVAEWVQDGEAAGILAGWGCDYLQGALIGLASLERPWMLPAAQMGTR